MQHYTHVVSVLGKLHRVRVPPLLVGQCERRHAVEEVVYLADYSLAAGCLAVGKAALHLLKRGDTRRRLRHIIRIEFSVQAAPRQDSVLSGLQVQRHAVAVGLECVAAFRHLPEELSVGIEHIEVNRLHLRGESVGKLHVAVIDKAHVTIGVTVAFVLVNHAA